MSATGPGPELGAVLAAVDRRAGETVDLLERLIAIDSRNPSYPGAARDGAAGGESRVTAEFYTCAVEVIVPCAVTTRSPAGNNRSSVPRKLTVPDAVTGPSVALLSSGAGS